MSLVWTKHAELYERVYVSSGRRGVYRISLDKSADRWAIYVDDAKRVENIYYIANAKNILEVFESKGAFVIMNDLRPHPDGELPLILSSPQTKSHGEPLEPSAHSDFPSVLPPSSVLTKLLPLPQPEIIAAKLHSLVINAGISPEKAGTPWLPWQSGVYALIDCIYSSQAIYDSVVLPSIHRLSARPNLRDQPNLGFTTFVEDVDRFAEDKFEQYAVQVLTRNKIAGRLKTEICYEAACFFARRGFETIADLQKLEAKLEPLILNELQFSIRGIGPALSHYLLTLLGDEDHVKLDIMISRFWARMKDWSPRASNEHDYQIVIAAFRDVASQMESTPARLDNAIWRYESDRAKASDKLHAASGKISAGGILT